MPVDGELFPEFFFAVEIEGLFAKIIKDQVNFLSDCLKSPQHNFLFGGVQPVFVLAEMNVLPGYFFKNQYILNLIPFERLVMWYIGMISQCQQGIGICFGQYQLGKRGEISKPHFLITALHINTIVNKRHQPQLQVDDMAFFFNQFIAIEFQNFIHREVSADKMFERYAKMVCNTQAGFQPGFGPVFFIRGNIPSGQFKQICKGLLAQSFGSTYLLDICADFGHPFKDTCNLFYQPANFICIF